MIAQRSALLFLFQKGKLLFEDGPHWRVHRYGCILTTLRPGNGDQAVVKIKVLLLQSEQFATPQAGKHGEFDHASHVLPGPGVQGGNKAASLLRGEEFGFDVVDPRKLNFEVQARAQAMLGAMIDEATQQPQGMANGCRRQALSLHVFPDALHVQGGEFGHGFLLEEFQVQVPPVEILHPAFERHSPAAAEIVLFDFLQGAVCLPLGGPYIPTGHDLALVPGFPEALRPEFRGKLRGVAFG